MFSRRKRSSSHHQPLSLGASQSAQSAASHAFLNSQQSSNSLSSAAAAAALRSLTPTPTPVENVQTKRMVQRRASTQSPASPLAARRSMSHEPLRRRGSSGSMTARTFREPSPRRPASSSGPLHTPPVDVPPLPSVPSQYANRKIPPRRAMSMQPQTRSPPTTPPRSAARGMSSDQGREGSSGVHSAHYRLSSLSTVPELERPTSRSSINFSRPISPPAISESRPLGLDATAASEVPSAEVAGAQQPISRVPEKPNITRPRTQAAGSSEGRRSIKSSAAPVGTAVAAAQAVSVQKAAPRAEPAHARVERIDPGPSDISVQEPVDHPLPVAVTTEAERPSSRAIPGPSTVVEEQEPEDDTAANASQAREANNRLASASPTVNHVEALPTPQPSPKAEEPSPQQQAHLRHSSSPGRSARFAKWLSVSASGDQVHQPPPRSVSPFKSALKQPRGNSLSPDGRAGIVGRGVHPPSEISDGTSVASDEGSRNAAKRKSVKVSFDDEAEVVGVAASPPTSPDEYVSESPPSKTKSRMSWLGLGRKKQSDFGTGDDDFDEVMKPRPELPSFGSVRGNRDGDQRPPVPDFSDDESTASSDEDVSAEPGVAIPENLTPVDLPSRTPNDELSQAHGVKSLEQLSVSGTPSASEQKPSDDSNIDSAAVGGLAEQPPHSDLDPSLTVPAIAVQPATPSVDERTSLDTTRSSMERYSHIPGGFPPSNSDKSLKSIDTGAGPPSVGSTAPKPSDMDGEGDSDDSVYSDAPEDVDGDGFGSINAIVDGRPIPRSSAPLATISESRETTPRAADRTALVDAQSEDVTDQVTESARTATPTQKPPSAATTDSPSSMYSQPSPGLPTPSLPVKSNARVSQTPNGVTQSRTVSVDAHGGSSQQDPRFSKQANGSPTSKAKQRPVSLGPAFQMNRPTALRRTTSNGSDSSSSFKRSSPSPRDDGPRTMRRTMRSNSTYAAIAFPSDRAESPNDYRPLSSGSGTGTMRKTLRNQGAGNERHSFFSTNKKAQGHRPRFGKGPSKGKKVSRFVDSDDEDDGARPQVFRSRFADSSDEDEPGSNLRPVRGIPRLQGADDGDSTELEDSSEEDRQPAPRPVVAPPVTGPPPTSRGRDASQPNMSGLAAVARQRGMTQRELEEFLMQPPRGRRSGFLARLGIKKAKNPDNRIRKADVESPSRRDTPLERSRLEREQLREEGYMNGNRDVTTTVTTGPYEPISPQGKLLKRNKRFTIAGGSWPLRPAAEEGPPAPVMEQSNSAPSSPLREQTGPAAHESVPSNGGILVNEGSHLPPIKESVVTRAGPDVNDAASDVTSTTNNEEVGPSARDIVIAGSGRKKARFSLLRKAFGRKT